MSHRKQQNRQQNASKNIYEPNTRKPFGWSKIPYGVVTSCLLHTIALTVR